MNDQSQMMNQPQMINPPPQMMINPPQGLGQPQMMNRSYGMWPPPPQTSMEMMNYPNPMTQGFIAQNPMKPRNWQGKKGNDKRKDGRRKEMPPMAVGSSSSGYQPPALADLQNQNRMKARRFYPKKKYNRFAPYAPRNTTSFIIRAKKSGGITDLVSPCPVTPAVLPTPNFSPSREILGDMAKEEWGVDGYGSMKGLIRLRSPGHEAELVNEEEDDDEGGSSESDVEEHLEVERRLDHDLSRFEMIYPNYGVDYNNNLLENRVDDQDTHIAQLEEENILLKERLFLMEREMGDLRRRLLRLESSRRKQASAAEENNEEVVDSVSENESEDREEIDNKIGTKSEVEFHDDSHVEELADKQQNGMNNQPEQENSMENREIGIDETQNMLETKSLGENSLKEVDAADGMKLDLDMNQEQH